MATPVAHCLAGYSIYYLARSHSSTGGTAVSGVLLATLLLGANLPDLDFLPGFLFGNPERFHREFSHSLAFAGMSVLPLIIYLKASAKPGVTGISICWLLAVLSHLLIDWLSLDTSIPSGIELLWPFSTQRFTADIPLFLGARRDELFSSFTISYNLIAITWEMLMLLPFVAACRYMHYRLTPCRDSSSSGNSA